MIHDFIVFLAIKHIISFLSFFKYWLMDLIKIILDYIPESFVPILQIYRPSERLFIFLIT